MWTEYAQQLFDLRARGVIRKPTVFGHVFDKTRETYFCLGARAVDRDRRTAVRRRTRARVANAPGRRRGGGGGGGAVNRCDGAKRQDGRQARDRRQRAKQQLIVFLLHDARPPNGVGVTKTDRRKLGPSSDDLSAHTLDGRSGGRGDGRRLERLSESLEFTGDDAGNVRRKRSFISETTCRWCRIRYWRTTDVSVDGRKTTTTIATTTTTTTNTTTTVYWRAGCPPSSTPCVPYVRACARVYGACIAFVRARVLAARATFSRDEIPTDRPTNRVVGTTSARPGPGFVDPPPKHATFVRSLSETYSLCGWEGTNEGLGPDRWNPYGISIHGSFSSPPHDFDRYTGKKMV